MKKEEFKNFLNNQTLSRQEWSKGIKFLYNGNEGTGIKIIKNKINKIIKSNKNEELIKWDFRKYESWKNCVNDIINKKEKYLKKLLEREEPVKFIIFSEAPKLTWKNNKPPYSAYLFGDRPVPGNYKIAPIKAFAFSENIIETFAHHRVAFIDLLDLPIPIDGNLRNEWNYNFKIDEDPLSVFLLENAIENFIQKSNSISQKYKRLYNLKFDSDVYFAFMMPPKTSMGIIEHYFKENKSINITVDDVNVFLPNERIIQCNNAYMKFLKTDLEQELLPLYSRVAMSGSNTPSYLLLKHALNLI